MKNNEMIINNTKYDNHIRISHTATGSYRNYRVNESDWRNLPVPTSMARRLHDVDVDAFTDLLGFTHRNRVRDEVEDFDLGYAILNDDDEAYLLELIRPEWFYVELINKRTKKKEIHKMYASDKEWNVYHCWRDASGNWHEANTDFAFSLVEE